MEPGAVPSPSQGRQTIKARVTKSPFQEIRGYAVTWKRRARNCRHDARLARDVAAGGTLTL
jgi:hypothetical protein